MAFVRFFGLGSAKSSFCTKFSRSVRVFFDGELCYVGVTTALMKFNYIFSCQKEGNFFISLVRAILPLTQI